jgi:hypothetical protein
MTQELTTEYNMVNYLEAIKGLGLITYCLEGYGEIPSTMYVPAPSYNGRLSSIREKSHEKLGEGWSRLAKL